MGIDVARFCGEVDRDLLCPICSFVLEDPIQVPTCEHAFCKSCIFEWLTRSQTCPIDRTTIDALKPAPRIMRNFLSRLTLTCSNQTHGCPAILTLERLEAHLLQCNFDPKRLITCQSGCGLTMPYEESVNHNCLESLKIEMESKLAIVQKENEVKISKLQSELDLLKANQTCTVFTDSRWLTNFEIVNVNSNFCLNSNWRLISRPVHLMLEVARECLSKSGCPLEMVNTLIQNSYESRWPPGLRSKKARRANQDRLTAYRCRYRYVRSPKFNFDLNIIMASDNTHMDQDIFVINPGFLVLYLNF
ncbi:E3 ubiquitin-protein ligase NRDP1-like isoform X2 [Artemia franciscana]|uniref:E3 ubiquitin-protein ligase NRDP1 n=2 Tax=Artemia franciscana TaxID=6661 RepID=A0AA88IMC4_ARTSF|nr:hypothetical protein QYM36_001816 [Artemia franciscana]